ncbi:MAG TPA: ATP-binding cassette domain-containing protein [Bryobacteraceae bacterium]|nr:ATP-binding cassette domain-containing protein [Bryobacteraceae bacterium]
MRRLLAPEVVQTSNLDCGPAALKGLLEGFGIPASYGRLREACQTGLDGTSIDTMEIVANQLGLEAEQIMLPVDHLLLEEAAALPAIVVVVLPNGLTHFVVVWRRHGKLLQVMDPAVGRRWVPCAKFVSEMYNHAMPVGAADWREFAVSDSFQSALNARMRAIGIGKAERARLLSLGVKSEGWRPLAALDAATRLLTSLTNAKGVLGARHRAKLLERLIDNPDLIPLRCWSVRAIPGGDEREEQVLMRGAVLVRVKDQKKSKTSAAEIRSELALAVGAPQQKPGTELARAVWQSGWLLAPLLLVALLVAAGGTLLEALLFRGLLDINTQLNVAGQRMGAGAALLLFGLAMLLLEVPAFASSCRLGRQLENRLRILFLEKIPKLSDRYFQSRLTSDMAERSHVTHRLRNLPVQARQLLSSLCQLAATGAGILWLEPTAAPFVVLAMAAAVLPILGAQSLLIERDLRTRSHAAGLTRYYLDAMLGLVAIAAHGARQSVRREQEKLLGEWAHAALRLQRAIVSTETLQAIATFGLVIALVLTRPLQGAEAGRILLVAYWALSIPVLGQEICALARQYPAYRNLTLRVLDPLGAPEENEPVQNANGIACGLMPPVIEFHNVSFQASGHTILSDIDLKLKAGSHVAIVGPSGAGKSSLMGLLLGWSKPSQGEVLVNGEPPNHEQLRRATAWVDPSVQIWNRSLFSNLTYGSASETPAVGEAIDTAMLRGVLESLPEGLQTKLGEGGGLVSGGEGQRVRLGRALLREDAKLVLLDEPFRGLDREKRRELLTRARAFWSQSTLICITHDLSETTGFDQVVVVENGRIAEHGTPSELLNWPESRYTQMLEAEEAAASDLWRNSMWRRIQIQSGRITEDLPVPAKGERGRSAVA